MIDRHLTGSAAALAAAVVLILRWGGLDVTEEVAAAIVGLVAILVSAAFPRWDGARGLILDAHPAGVTAAVVAVATWLAPLVGVNLTADAVAILVGALTAVVSLATPRVPDEDHRLDPTYTATHDEADQDVDRVSEDTTPVE